jgi:hypothetical protein
MEDAFQARLGRGIGENLAAHGGAVERAARVDDLVAEGGADRHDGGAAGRGEGMGDGVGVHHRGAELLEQASPRRSCRCRCRRSGRR